MSQLTIFHDETGQKLEEYSEFQEIHDTLRGIGIVFERWKADIPLSETATPEEVLQAYQVSIERLKAQRGYITVDVVSLTPNAPNLESLRQKFLDEHIHTEDEVRFFVDGRGMFYIHQNGKVYMILCEKGDLINLPAGTKHWFDMGPKPFFKAIRFFNNPEGWVAHYTGDAIAQRFPKFENT